MTSIQPSLSHVSQSHVSQSHVSQTASSLTEQKEQTQHDKAVDVARKFEALLLFTMMKSMRASLTEDTLTGSEEQNMYREMMDREIAESIARSGGLGLQNLLTEQLSLTPTQTENSLGTDTNSKSGIDTFESSAASRDFLARQRIAFNAVRD